jgi:hypothetical protein
MIKHTLTIVVAAAAALVAPGSAGAEESKMETKAAVPAPIKSGRVEAGGVSYYYEIRGEGEPLLMLHGGLGSIDMFGRCCRCLPRAGR